MQLTPMTPRPAPDPHWTGITVATVPIWNGGTGLPMALVSTGTRGRAGGYDSQANAMRAARMLSRGSDVGAMAVIARDQRWYVQGILARLDAGSGGNTSLHFEAALPARVGNAVLRESAVVRPAMGGVVAVVDGARTLPLG